MIHEKSPHLLQHAHQPVDWYPWGEEAFEKARDEGKPIFLSIGYATCHFCEQMAKESFTDPVVAKEMNAVFVSIKVDREELPEIDTLYMEFAEALMSKQVGWPLNIILTPELKPFYAVSYLPPEPRHEVMSFRELIHHIDQLWHSEEKELLFDQANRLVDLFEKSAPIRGEEAATEETLEEAIDALYALADPVHGGMGGAPKFPLGYQLTFLLSRATLQNDARPLFLAKRTLDKMAQGGIYDHVGGGFFRYSVDEKWHVPHFEKTIADQALLAAAYLEGWQAAKDPSYKAVCQQILDFSLNEMHRPGGGFYAAEGGGLDGSHLLWTKEEIAALLPKEACEIFCAYYDVTESGNYKGKNILRIPLPFEEFCDSRELPLAEIKTLLERSLSLLAEARKTRTPPFKDDKIVVSWNALMIDTLIRAGTLLEKEEYLSAALTATTFIQKHLWKEGKLLRHYRKEATHFKGSLNDYAFLIRALLTLYEAGYGHSYLDWAIEMTDYLENVFKADEGAFYLTGPDRSILLRRCELCDSAEPSGNAVHTENLLRLHAITQKRDYLLQAEEILKVAKSFIDAYPQGAFYHLAALQRFLDKEACVLVIAQSAPPEKELARTLFSSSRPHLSLIWKTNDPTYPPLGGQTTFYPIIAGKCSAPLTDVGMLDI